MYPRGRRLLWLVGGAACASSLAGIALSCLPDLEGTPNPPVKMGPVCGDGIIDVDGGEQCDPGIKDASVPGCSRTCKIECDAGRLPAYLDPNSNHCYFLLSEEAGTFEAGLACDKHRAHPVTLGSSVEVGQITGEGVFSPALPIDLWLGLRADPPDSATRGLYRAVVDEPGFNRADGGCRGCFLPLGAAPAPSPDECLTWPSNKNLGAWRPEPCGASFATLCEREPAGSRRYPCGDLTCFNIPYEVTHPTHKTYVWAGIAGAMSADAAAAYCGQLGGDGGDSGGTGTLVVFTSDEQREQVFYELMNLPVPPDGGPPTDFWLGYTRRTVSDGGLLEWVWDDGRTYLPQWGDHEPRSVREGVRAFAAQSGASYGTPGATYDTQLMHAHDPPADGGIEVHAVLCQVLQ